MSESGSPVVEDAELERLMDEWHQSIEEAARTLARWPIGSSADAVALICDVREKRREALRSYVSQKQREAIENATRGWLMCGPAQTIFPKVEPDSPMQERPHD